MPQITRRKRKEKAITTTHGHGLVVASEYYTDYISCAII